MNLILVRHGETLHNKQGRVLGGTDTPLNDLGKEQARATARFLAQELPFLLYSSPVARAMETARIIGEAAGVSPKIIVGMEEADAGELEGLTGTEMRERFPEFMTRWREDSGTARMPGGESLAQVQERAWKAILAIYEQHQSETVVVVSHNFTTLTVVSKVLGLPLRDFRRLRVSLGGVTRIEITEDRKSLVSLNETGHLRCIR